MSRDIIAQELQQRFSEHEYAHSYAEDFAHAFIATQIKVLREDRGLTQAQLAELAGMKQSRISTLEDINYGSWNLKTLRRLAVAFDVAVTVRFECFSKLIDEVSSFSRERLHRPPRMDDLASSSTARDSLPLPINVTPELQPLAAQPAQTARSAAMLSISGQALPFSSVLEKASPEWTPSARDLPRWTMPANSIYAYQGFQ